MSPMPSEHQDPLTIGADVSDLSEKPRTQDHSRAGCHTSNHAHGHVHDHSLEFRRLPKSRLWMVFLLTIAFMFVEAIVGYFSGSLVLLADAGHMLNDAASIAMALLAIHLASKKSTYQQTFGYKRVEVISAMANGVSLIAIAGYIVREAIVRAQSFDDLEIRSIPLIVTAALGLLVNMGGLYLLRPAKEDSINVEGAYQHVMADLFGSIGAIVAGLGIYLWEATWLDLLASVVVSLLILKSGINISVHAFRILLETSPPGIDIQLVIADLEGVEGVSTVHDFHAWRITNGLDVITAHLIIEESANSKQILLESRRIAEDHGFHHTTFQLDLLPCDRFADCVPNCENSNKK